MNMSRLAVPHFAANRNLPGSGFMLIDGRFNLLSALSFKSLALGVVGIFTLI